MTLNWYFFPFLNLPGIPKGGVKGLIIPGTGLGEAAIIPSFHAIGWLPLPRVRLGQPILLRKLSVKKILQTRWGLFPSK